LFVRQDGIQTQESIADTLGDVSEQIAQICEDSRLEALLTDDVGNLSVRFQRVKVTGEDISGVDAVFFVV